MGWIHLALKKTEWWVLVTMLRKCQVPQKMEILTSFSWMTTFRLKVLMVWLWSWPFTLLHIVVCTLNFATCDCIHWHVERNEDLPTALHSATRIGACYITGWCSQGSLNYGSTILERMLFFLCLFHCVGSHRVEMGERWVRRNKQ